MKKLSARGFKGDKHQKLLIFDACRPQEPLGASKKSLLKNFLDATSRTLKNVYPFEKRSRSILIMKFVKNTPEMLI